MRTSTIAVGLLAAVLLVGGCGSDPETSNDPVSQADANDDAGANGDLDAPNPGGDQPSAELPGLPIGGQIPDTALTASSTSGCGTVPWVGPGELIPDGIEVTITKFHLPDQVSVDDAACGGAGPSCLGGVSFRGDQTSCTLGVRWNGEPPDWLNVRADGWASCDEQSVCDRFEEDLVTQTAFLVIESSEPEEEVTPEEGDPLLTPSVTDPPSDGTE